MGECDMMMVARSSIANMTPHLHHCHRRQQRKRGAARLRTCRSARLTYFSSLPSPTQHGDMIRMVTMITPAAAEEDSVGNKPPLGGALHRATTPTADPPLRRSFAVSDLSAAATPPTFPHAAMVSSLSTSGPKGRSKEGALWSKKP
jgi:hypothetical protein